MNVTVLIDDRILNLMISQELEYNDYNVKSYELFDSSANLVKDAQAVIVNPQVLVEASDYDDAFKLFKVAQEQNTEVIFVGDVNDPTLREIAFQNGVKAFIDKCNVRHELIFLLNGVLRPNVMFTGFRAVVVDDTEDALELVTAQLEDCGVDVLNFNNATDAYLKIKELNGAIDILITDQKMEGMSGTDLCERVKIELGLKCLPIVFLTGYSDKENILNLYKAGASDHLIKPYYQEELWEKVKGHLRRQLEYRRLTRKIVERDEIDNLKSEFLAISTYDLKVPIGFISGYTEILQDVVEDDYTEYVNKISSAQENLDELIDEIQGLTRFLNAGITSKNMDVIEISNTVGKAIAGVTSMAQSKKVALSVDAALENSSIKAKGNCLALTKAIGKVLESALSLSKEGDSIAIEVSEGNQGGSLDLKIIGNSEMTSDVVKNNFNMFLRGQSASEKNGAMAGLGIAKNIIEIHGGVFLLQQNSKGQGFFQMSLPN